MTEVKVYVMDGEEEMTHGTCDLAIRRADGARRPYMALTPCIWMQAPSVRV